jgi:hypothetical protein
MQNQKNTKTTTKSVSNLCSDFLSRVTKLCEGRSDLILLAWSEIIGEKLAPMTRATRFFEGILYVDVSSSSLLSILTYKEKKFLIKKLKEKFPKADIKDIRFRIG